MRLRTLSADQIRQVLPMRDAIEALREGFRALHAGDVEMPVRRQLELEEGIALFMPAYLRRQGALVEKVVSVNRGNRERGLPAVHALVTVYDPTTGAPSALLEGGALTALRTGAATGLAAGLLAPRGARRLTVFGAGVQAPAQIEAVLEVRPEIEEVRIITRGDSGQRLAERLGGEDRARRYTADDDPAVAVRDADVIVTVTTSDQPLFDGSLVRDLTLVAAVGAFQPHTREVDTALVTRSAVVVDQLEAAREEAGDLIIPAAEGRWSWDRVYAELGTLAAGEKAAPQGRPVLFKSCGLAVEDAASAHAALLAAERLDVGGFVEL